MSELQLSPEALEALERRGLGMEVFTPVTLGPTWKRDDDGNWLLPDKTLGWEIAQWCAKYLRAEGGGPWRFTNEQLRYVLWWYAVDDDGEFIYRTSVLQRLKGWGKDPLAAVLCLVEFVGPSRFSHFNAFGLPVGKRQPNAWIQIAAVSQSQTKNTVTLFPSLMSDEFIAAYDVEPQQELIRGMGRTCRIEAVTSNYRTLEGGRTTFSILNETHHWISGNGGHAMYQTVDGNVTKKDSRYIAITNAYLPGEDSVAEQMRETYEKTLEGKQADVGLLYDSLEAHPRAPLDPLLLPYILDIVRGDAVWLKPKAIIKSILTGSIPLSRSRRMWLNQIVADEDALIDKAAWSKLQVDDQLRPGDEVALGFDGGKTDDATALVAIRISDGFVQPLLVEEKPDGPAGDGWQVNTEKVDSAVHDAFRMFKVVAFYADVALWESYIDAWSREYAEGLALKASTTSAIGWDMRQSQKTVTRAHEQLLDAIFTGRISHDGDPTLQRHVLNARRRANSWGVSFGKESRESPRKVDAYAALLLAHEARRDYFSRGKKKRERTGRSYFL